jgi:hypothetical protein
MLGDFSPSVVTSVQPWREAVWPQFCCSLLSWAGKEGRVGQQKAWPAKVSCYRSVGVVREA